MTIYDELRAELQKTNNPVATGTVVFAKVQIIIAEKLDLIAESLGLIAVSQARQTIAIESAAIDDEDDAPGEAPVAAEGIQTQAETA